MKHYQEELIRQSMAVGALKFGSFTLKSGRISPYFFNAGLLNSGPILVTLSTAYAATIAEAGFPPFDVLFGPAYKGIPFAAITVLQLELQHQISVGLAYDRKEVKDHGEGGKTVGVPLRGKRVIVLDDVMSSGKAVRESIQTVRSQGGEVVGVVQCLDREEVGQDGHSSAVKEVEGLVGSGRAKSIIKLRDLVSWLEGEKGEEMKTHLEGMREYFSRYGIKD